MPERPPVCSVPLATMIGKSLRFRSVRLADCSGLEFVARTDSRMPRWLVALREVTLWQTSSGTGNIHWHIKLCLGTMSPRSGCRVIPHSLSMFSVEHRTGVSRSGFQDPKGGCLLPVRKGLLLKPLRSLNGTSQFHGKSERCVILNIFR